MTVTLSNLNRFSKILSPLKTELNSQQNPYNIFNHTLTMFPHDLGKSNLLQITTDKFKKSHYV